MDAIFNHAEAIELVVEAALAETFGIVLNVLGNVTCIVIVCLEAMLKLTVPD